MSQSALHAGKLFEECTTMTIRTERSD